MPQTPASPLWMPLYLMAFSRWQSEPDGPMEGARPARFPCSPGIILPVAMAASLDAGVMLWMAAWPRSHSVPVGVKKVWTVVTSLPMMPKC